MALKADVRLKNKLCDSLSTIAGNLDFDYVFMMTYKTRVFLGLRKQYVGLREENVVCTGSTQVAAFRVCACVC